jgi:hypothetical protein
MKQGVCNSVVGVDLGDLADADATVAFWWFALESLAEAGLATVEVQER